MPRITALHMLRSTMKTVSAPASSSFRGSIAHPTQPLCTLRVRRCRRLTQHSLPGGLLGLTCAGLPPAESRQLCLAPSVYLITSSAVASSVGGTVPADKGGADSPTSLQSTLTPAASATSVHFFRSAAMKAAKSCGEPIFGLALSLTRVACKSGDFMISLIAALSLPTMFVGVPAGARTPFQYVAC